MNKNIEKFIDWLSNSNNFMLIDLESMFVWLNFDIKNKKYLQFYLSSLMG